MFSDPMSLQTKDHRFEVNWRSLSVVMEVVTPNCAIQPETNDLATFSAVILVIRNASDHFVNRSILVNRYMKFSEGGKGLTMSI